MLERAFLIVLDSVGAGALPDAAAYGDEGASTLEHVINACHPHLPNMAAMGLGSIPGVPYPKDENAVGAFGKAIETSAGKDTTTGHWELAGIKLDRPFPTYPDGFPEEVISAFEKAIGTKTLGNYAASGTAILDELGEEHIRTGYPIVYTSADSVFQIAANERVIPPERLYEICRAAREILSGEHAVGRVIARPFVGEKKGGFTRTSRRRDFSLPPTGRTLLEAMSESGLTVSAVGKIEDIFCMKGITRSDHAAGNPACVDALLGEMALSFKGLVFVNLVDFDMVYGHRNDARGYADALEYFDGRLPEIKALMRPGDLLIITADHGCDPTYPGTDHTREYAPILVWRPESAGLTDIGIRKSFADIAATIAEGFGLPDRFGADSFFGEL